MKIIRSVCFSLALIQVKLVHGFVSNRFARTFSNVRSPVSSKHSDVNDDNADYVIVDPIADQSKQLKAPLSAAIPGQPAVQPQMDADKAFSYMELAADYMTLVMAAFVTATFMLNVNGYGYCLTDHGIGTDTIAHLRELQDFQNEVLKMSH